MEHSNEFERLLDAHLAAEALRVPHVSVPPPPFDCRPDPALRFVLWGGGIPPMRPQAGRAMPRGMSPMTDGGAWAWPAEPAAAPTPVPPIAPAPVRPRPRPAREARRARAVSPAARAAVETMKRAGEDLTESFTLDELKAAYRRLAFRYHPDQHPAADLVERTQLSASFSRVHAAYRQLGRLFLS